MSRSLLSASATVLIWSAEEKRCLEEVKGHHRDAVRAMLAVRDDATGKEALWTGGDEKDASYCVYEAAQAPLP